MLTDITGKKLLVLGANPETSGLVKVARELGVTTLVTDYDPNAPAKRLADKAFNVDGLDITGLIKLARDESVDGVLVGVADMLVPSYQKVCAALGFPCYATEEIIRVFSRKDHFKSKCEQYGIRGIPEYQLDASLEPDDVSKIRFPVMVKPVDSASGTGMTLCYAPSDLHAAVQKALAASPSKRFIVEKYMECDDMGLYYTFKDGVCSISCVYDRYTTSEQPGVSRVCLGGTYPSKHIDAYLEKMHPKALRLFNDLHVKDGVLMLSAFYDNEEFYVYDVGFRFQGEAPHLLMKAIHGYDQREMLIRFALTGSQGGLDLAKEDDPKLRGRHAATMWLVAKAGKIAHIEGLEHLRYDAEVVSVVQRLKEGDFVDPKWVGTEKQVVARIYVVCCSKVQLHKKLEEILRSIKIVSSDEKDMLLRGFPLEIPQ